MSLAITPEQEELRAIVRQFLTRKSPAEEVRRLMATTDGFDRAVWKEMAEGLGLHGLAIPEEFGGAGYGSMELAVVFEEMGRALLVAPFFSSVALAAPLLLELDDDDAKQSYLPGIADGSLLATVAVAEDGGAWDLDSVRAAASPSGDDWVLDGVKSFVPDGHLVDVVLVVARVAEGLGVFAVPADAAGLTRTPLETLDQTRKLARLELTAVRARRVGTGDASAAVARTLDIAIAALAAEQVGGAGRCLDAAVEFAKIREQFGRPIGSFQAIKHICADMLMSVESARSAAYYASWAAAESTDELARSAAVAKAYCSDAYFKVASDNIQVHGGIGVTWEHDAHLYFRRAKSSQLLFGDPQLHRSRIAALAGI